MKYYVCLLRHGKYFYPINHTQFYDLRHLVEFFAGDYRSYDQGLFVHALNCYDVTFVYHDFEQSMMYIGFSEWEMFEEIDIPDDKDFPNYVNESNSCKVTVDNFKVLIDQFQILDTERIPFACVYRDNNDWVACKGFNFQSEMELFLKSMIQ